ncbi:purple acid phosphatase family protein [Actinoplanes aureus]|uniref:Metallophosphoesterase family protein n=1 Tax=Actinoplanes aureus TaxID=2792083 RepID=A0A931C9Z4_9ACTN|nr:metallophosphoesterase family protein [Actinoplanes aureus]MBG0562248.1 metallophosphoesterase family protein [Actinoplanes aureus]
MATVKLTVDEYSDANARELARQGVSRRTILRTAVAGYAYAQFQLADAAFAAAGGTAGQAGVVVAGRHLSFVPGADGALKPAMAVTAQLASKTGTLPPKLRAYVDVGSAPGQYGTRVEADIRHLVGRYAIPGGPIGSQFYLKATIDGLRPGTVHHYRVRLSDGTVSGDAHFTTAPADRAVHAPFTFTAFADVGTNTAPTDPRYAWNQNPPSVTKADGTWPAGVFDGNAYLPDDPVAGLHGTDKRPALTQTLLMATQRPVFTLLAGDICYANPSGSGLPADDTTALTRVAPKGKNLYNPYVWDVFLNQIEPLAAYTPWMFATGNHDMEPLYGNTRFLGDSPAHGYGGLVERLDFPDNGPKTCPSVYRFTYANVGVISIDANDLSHELQTNTGYSGGAQLSWVKGTLKKWRADDDIDFIVAFFHHCAYSTTDSHASDGGVRDALDPLFSKYQVDLVVQGHNHLLERTDPIRYGKRTRSAPDGSTIHPATDGVTYLCVGSGGRARYPFRRAPGPQAPPPPKVTPKGPQKLAAGQRYRGYRPPGGPNTKENNTENIVNSYVWAKGSGAVKPAGQPAGSRVPETIDWSQVRYDAYAFMAVDVVPAARGARTTLTVRCLADALPGSKQPFTEIDRITLARTAGKSAVRT